MSSNNNLVPVDTLFNGLIKKFNPENAKGLNITYKFNIEGYDPIYVQIKDETAKLIDSAENIDTTLSMSHETWYKICFNEISGQDALMDGLIEYEGNLRNFASMPKIFNKDL